MKALAGKRAATQEISDGPKEVSTLTGGVRCRLEEKIQFLAIRLLPDCDLRAEIEKWCKDENIDAGSIISLVGSLKVACIRFAGQDSAVSLEGPFEIVASTGTIGARGVHIHIAIADGAGKMIGGHLAHGSIVNTTVELCACNLSGEWVFDRAFDERTGSTEIDCRRKK